MISRRSLAAAALLCLCAMAHAQTPNTKAQINTQITNNFPDNINGAITPQVLRNVTSNIVNSIMPTAPVTSGGPSCFNGTTGLLQDCTAGTITNFNLAPMTANTVKCNPTGATSAAQDCATPVINGMTLLSTPFSMTGTNPGLELGNTSAANTPFINFHSSGNNILYDARLIASGGNASIGNGTLQLVGAFSIQPPANTLLNALTIGQSASGGTGSPIDLNAITISSDNSNAGSAFLNGLHFAHSFGGASAQGGRQAMWVSLTSTAATNATNPNRNYVAGTFSAYAGATDGGTNLTTDARGGFFGMNPIGIARTGATNLLEASGGEVNYAIQTGASAKYKMGWSIVLDNTDAVRGSAADCGLCISSQATAGTGMQVAMLVGNMNGVFPLSTDSTVLGVTSGSIALGVDFSNLTFSNSAFISPGFKVDGAGKVSTPTVIANTAPNAVPSIDVSNASVTVANGANVSLAAGAGFIVIKNTTNNSTAIYLVGAGSGILVGQLGNIFVAPTTTPAAGNASVAFNGTNNKYTIYNNIGASTTFIVGTINTGGI